MFDLYIGSPDNIGIISIGDFYEDFEVITDLSSDDIQDLWEAELTRFTSASCNSILLPTWFERNIVNRAWACYEVNNNVYIRELLLAVTGEHKFGVDAIPEREVYSEDGDTISEWETTMDDIINFLNEQNEE